MIPSKTKPYAECTTEERLKRLVRPLSTELQTLAQKENFALFVLKGMLGNLNHLRELDSSDANRLEYYVKQSIARIKSRQNSRNVRKLK